MNVATDPAENFDAIVVGAGPAGSAAALGLANAGKRVALVERGVFPGAKNVYGGVIYGRILDSLVPNWWEEAPVQRWVTRRVTMMLSEGRSLAVDFRSDSWGTPPYNGATAFRPDFDAWFASKAVDAGATLLCSTTVTGLLQRSGRVVGVRTDRPLGDLEAPVVIACDGVNSFLAKEAGLYPHSDPHNFTLGVKETLHLPRSVIEERFSVRGDEGADFEVLGCTQGIPGGGFIYTNKESLSVGLVLSVPALAAQDRRPEDLIAAFKDHPSVAPLVQGGELTEYSAHLIPEAGFDMMPTLFTDGLLIAGDAAAMCLATGIWLEGVNFAIAAGAIAARAATEALASGDTSAAGLSRYQKLLDESFVMVDHRRLKNAPKLVMGDSVQQRYPDLICDLVEELFTVRNPAPKPRLVPMLRRAAKARGVRITDMVKDAGQAGRTFG